MNSNLKNDFSWSIFRYELYEFCNLAYYFYYYASWNGWLQDSNTEAKDFYKLKKLINKNQIINNTLKKGIYSFLYKKNSQERNLYALKKEFLAQLNKELFNNNIYEIFYQIETIDEIKHWCLSKINIIIEELTSNNNLFLKEILFPIENKYYDFIDTYKPISFKYNDLLVWINPTIILRKNNSIYHFNFLINLTDKWFLKPGLCELYSFYSFKNIEFKNINIITTFLKDKKLYDCFWKHPIREIKNIITTSSNKMLNLLTPDKKAYRENFEKVKDNQKCNSCIFRLKCKKSDFQL